MPVPKDLALPGLINCLALIVYFAMSVNVGRLRVKLKVPAPQVTGNADFERALRVQQNTVEQLVLFLPALWLCAILFSPMVSGVLGGAWVLGRIVYAWGYYQAAEKRSVGFAIGMLAGLGLLGCALVGAVRAML